MAVGRGPLAKCLVAGRVTVNPYAGSAMAFIGGNFGGRVQPIELSLSQCGDPWRTAARAVAAFGAHHSDGVPGACSGRGGLHQQNILGRPVPAWTGMTGGPGKKRGRWLWNG